MVKLLKSVARFLRANRKDVVTVVTTVMSGLLPLALGGDVAAMVLAVLAMVVLVLALKKG